MEIRSLLKPSLIQTLTLWGKKNSFLAVKNSSAIHCLSSGKLELNKVQSYGRPGGLAAVQSIVEWEAWFESSLIYLSLFLSYSLGWESSTMLVL